MLMDPLVGAVCNPPEVWDLVDEMLIAQEQWLPQYKAISAARSPPPDLVHSLSTLGILGMGVMGMPRRRGVMSDRLKYELAAELGFYHKVQDGDWGNITTGRLGRWCEPQLSVPR